MIQVASKSLLLFLLIILFASCSGSVNLPESKITLRVVDEQGQAVENAKVSIGFVPMKEGKDIAIHGQTDSSGLYSAQRKSIESVAFNINKEGYYYSGGGYRFETNSKGKWQPWNPEIKVILRKIIKPVPMYARSTQMSKMNIPVVNKAIGFDLIEYDWMPPYGNGKHPDFIFRLEREFVDDRNFNCKLNINFSNKNDGIQQVNNEYHHSIFRLPRNAPETGYLSTISKTFSSAYDPTDKRLNYIFRVRSELVNNKLSKAMYGKIYGDIEFDPKGKNTASILFDYYLNPDYTNNLEFDPKQNLFTNMKSYEGLKNP